ATIGEAPIGGSLNATGERLIGVRTTISETAANGTWHRGRNPLPVSFYTVSTTVTSHDQSSLGRHRVEVWSRRPVGGLDRATTFTDARHSLVGARCAHRGVPAVAVDGDSAFVRIGCLNGSGPC